MKMIFLLISLFFGVKTKDSKGFFLKLYNSDKCEEMVGYSYYFTPEGCFYRGNVDDDYVSLETKDDENVIVTYCNNSACKGPDCQRYKVGMNKCMYYNSTFSEVTYESFGKQKESDYFGYQYVEDSACGNNLYNAMIFDSDECLYCACGNYYKLYCDGNTLMKHVWSDGVKCVGDPAEKYVSHQNCDLYSSDPEIYMQNSCEVIY